ncbi:MAG: DNA polymerase I [Candidatus Moranbacteria bacterium]|nr:DNA polymerase I [Candidatus Moranbacteria bacterium]
MKNKSKKLALIDGNAIIHRAFHALPPLTTKKGELVNAVYGFSSLMLKVINDLKPDYIAVSFDLAGPTFRHKEYKEYKATRVKAPQELYDQIERVKEVVRAMNIPIYEKEGFEADDIIGTLVSQAEKNKNIESLIVTGDLDTLQLVSDKTKVYALRKGMSDTVIYDAQGVIDRYHLTPEQVIDFKGLRGDASDNIPGVKGIGEKTATELLKKYKTVEGVYKNLKEIKGAVKDKLERDKMQAFMSKKLATIVKDAPIELDFSKAVTKEFDRRKLVELFQELNFFSLIKRIPDSNLRMENESTNNSGGVKDIKYEIVSEDKADEFIKSLSEQEEIAFCLDLDNENNIEGAAFSWKTGRATYLTTRNLQPVTLKSFFENDNVKKIGYDLKKDYKTLKKAGINLGGIYFDIMISAYALNPGGKTKLPNLVLEELGEEIKEESKKGQLGLEIESSESKAQKICQKVDYIWKLKEIILKKIQEVSAEQKREKDLNYLFEKIEMPLVPVLAEMEIAGIKLNTTIFKGISEKITKTIENLEKNIYKLAGAEFNINSPKQLSEILFVKLKIPTAEIKKIKTGYSTASAELAKLKKEYKIAEKIEEYRELFKLKTTYLDTLPELVDKNSRIHTDFNQAVTATGRLSSSEPNLQNIPIRTELGELLRTAFEAENGYKLVSADYSQIDLRVVAHMSGDKKMIETFYKGEDVHRKTAAEVNKIPISQVTEKMRFEAKALNFGVIYGMSVFGFSEAAGVDRDEAKRFINEYMEKFSGIAQYIRETKEFAKKNLYVETEAGRRRNIPEINSPNFQVQNAAERMAINMPIQGLAADIVKLAMIKVAEEYKNNEDARPVKSAEGGAELFNGVKMVLQIHDEIILEVKEDKAQEVAKKVKEIMENVYKLKVPLVVDVKIGDNWGTI